MTTDSTTPPTELLQQADGSVVELTDIPIRQGTLPVPANKALRLAQMEGRGPEDLGTLLSLCRDLFVTHWDRVRFGPCIEGAVFELELSSQPEHFSVLDGYLTVVLPPGPAHFHLCIAPTQGLAGRSTPEALAKKRQCSRAAFSRTLGPDGCTPGSWAVQMWNGGGEQMVTVFLPSPFLNDRLQPVRRPDWSRLALWNDLRARYLGELEPQPLPQVPERLRAREG